MFIRPYCQHFGPRREMGNSRMSPKPISKPPNSTIVLMLLRMYPHTVKNSEMGFLKSHCPS